MPVLQEGVFKQTRTKFDINCWGDLYLNGKFRTLQQMFSKLAPSSMDTFLYIRLWQGIKEYTPSYPQEPQTTPLHTILQSETATHVVSTLYYSIYANRALGQCTANGKWETDIGQQITDKQWTYCCTQTEQVSSSSRLRITHYKFLHRTYYTPAKMYKYKLRDNDQYDRCGREGADFLHLAWACNNVKEYWRQVFVAIGQMTTPSIQVSIMTALLGYTENIDIGYWRFVSIGLLLAKQRVACRWGRGRAPKFKEWVRDIIFWQDQTLTYAELLPLASRPRDIWDPLKTYLLIRPIDTTTNA